MVDLPNMNIAHPGAVTDGIRFPPVKVNAPMMESRQRIVIYFKDDVAEQITYFGDACPKPNQLRKVLEDAVSKVSTES